MLRALISMEIPRVTQKPSHIMNTFVLRVLGRVWEDNARICREMFGT